MDAVMIGIIFARISHPKYRGRTIAISDSAVISRRDGVLKFMFRIADFRRTQVCRIGLFPKGLMHDSGASRTRMLRALAAVSLVCPVPAWLRQAQQSLSDSWAASRFKDISTDGLLGCCIRRSPIRCNDGSWSGLQSCPGKCRTAEGRVVMGSMSGAQVVEPKVAAYLYTWGEGRMTAEGEHIPVRVEVLDVGYIDGMM